MNTTMPEQPVWDAGVKFSQFPKLTESVTADVVIIGGGLAGVTAAYLVSEAGKKVVLVEKDRLGRGATGLTTAFLTQSIDTDLTDVVRLLGPEKTKVLLESHRTAIDTVEDIIENENIDCDFMRCSNYIYAVSKKDRTALEEKITAGAKVGLPLRMHDSDLPFPHEGYLELENQAKFHPLKYLSALVTILKERGVQIYEETTAEKITPGSTCVVKAGAGEVRAGHVLVTTYAPFDKELFFKKAHYTSYVLHATVPRGALPEAIYEDTMNPYHYWRVDAGEKDDRLIFGGADHRSDIPVNEEKNFQALEEEMNARFLNIPLEIVARWSGPILETVDGLPYIGPVDHERVLYATGFSGNGMTYATIAAHILSDAVQNKVNPWLTLYDAKRTPGLRDLITKGLDYSEELLKGAVKNTLRHKG